MPIAKPPAEREPEDSSPVDMYAPLLAQIPHLNKATYLVSCRAALGNRSRKRAPSRHQHSAHSLHFCADGRVRC
jgi:hypothetical protein